ncbi:MAG: lytic transglycosylase domain-containing protein [Prevotella sp.]|nr:lytic transglycosylase domain-containing protein [Prevotella sp.]
MITKRLYQLLITMLLLCPLTLQAQVINQDDDDEDEVALNDTIDIDDDFPDLEEIVVIGEDEDGEEEEIVIDMPEALTLAVDSLLDLYHTQAYLQVDSTCNLPDYNPEYDREVYIERLQQLPTVIEMPYNDIVRQFIDRYSGRLRRSVSIMLGQQNFYMPIFEQALETYGLPLELRYLPIIESALKPNAVSRVGAAGLWQFMIATAKQYGLEVTSLVDERRDPIKSSNAAARYLKTLYKIFGDWHLVIAAYNCGPENVNKAVHRAGGVKDYWHIYPYLPAETRGYVPAFIAANYIMNYYCEHNICPMLSNLPAKTDTLVLNRDVHFEQIAGVLGVDVKLIEELNPQYRRSIVNGKNRPSILRLPMNYVTQFIDMEDSIYAHRADELLTKRVEVEVNDAKPTYTPQRKTYSRKKGSGRRGKVVVHKGSSRKAAAKKPAARGKKAVAKKGSARKAPAKKAPAKKSPAKKRRR